MFDFLTSYCELEKCSGFLKWFYDQNLIPGFGIPKYAFCIMIGLALAYIFGIKEAKKLGVNPDLITDGALIIVPISLIGTRLWYVLFDGENLFEYGFIKGLMAFVGFNPITGQYEGLRGLAIHGGFIVAVISTFIYCRIRKINIFKVVDLVAPGFFFGQICGRWGNFFNREAHGTVVGGFSENLTPLLTAGEQYDKMIHEFHIPKFIVQNMCMTNAEYDLGDSGIKTIVGSFYYHPTFLYESMLNLIGLAAILILRRTKLMRSGEMLSIYTIWYGIVRFIIEKARMDSLYTSIFGLKIAQIVSICLIVFGVLWFLWIRIFKKTDKYHQILLDNKIL